MEVGKRHLAKVEMLGAHDGLVYCLPCAGGMGADGGLVFRWPATQEMAAPARHVTYAGRAQVEEGAMRARPIEVGMHQIVRLHRAGPGAGAC